MFARMNETYSQFDNDKVGFYDFGRGVFQIHYMERPNWFRRMCMSVFFDLLWFDYSDCAPLEGPIDKAFRETQEILNQIEDRDRDDLHPRT